MLKLAKPRNAVLPTSLHEIGLEQWDKRSKHISDNCFFLRLRAYRYVEGIFGRYILGIFLSHPVLYFIGIFRPVFYISSFKLCFLFFSNLIGMIPSIQVTLCEIVYLYFLKFNLSSAQKEKSNLKCLPLFIRSRLLSGCG